MLMGSYLSTFGVLLLCTQYRALALRQQASHDPLTGLLNRRGFMELMARRRMTEFGALAVLDLDDFKQINDRHGHEMGIGCWPRWGLSRRSAGAGGQSLWRRGVRVAVAAGG